ncbi:MAG: hypothetical protein C5B59_09980 [Bacteroidetes bacterium]|nr:MAG: hypothetical protein C5B59_09980 [Bacteroidota bacterium]
MNQVRQIKNHMKEVINVRAHMIAKRLGCRFEKLSIAKKKAALLVFCLVSAGASVFTIVHATKSNSATDVSAGAGKIHFPHVSLNSKKLDTLRILEKMYKSKK